MIKWLKGTDRKCYNPKIQVLIHNVHPSQEILNITSSKNSTHMFLILISISIKHTASWVCLSPLQKNLNGSFNVVCCIIYIIYNVHFPFISTVYNTFRPTKDHFYRSRRNSRVKASEFMSIWLYWKGSILWFKNYMVTLANKMMKQSWRTE